ncbi:MAG: GGDEF domain-containing protein [Planctomycetes bacterium]|nr:GGDEF domain-containing protein [Planctomycetota bacterium]
MRTFWELFFLSMLGLTGVSGVLALVSPRAFSMVADVLSRRMVSLTPAGMPGERLVDLKVDGFFLRHCRFFGLLVIASAAYLFLLYAYGPAAISKPFLLLVVGISLGTGIAALIEIKKQKQQNECYRREAHTDVLTGLANRRAFDIELSRRISQRQRQGTTLCLLIMDVDHFKVVNDTYGHHAGDAILKGIAEILASQIRLMDVAARIGGDEFVVSLPGSDMVEASLMAERVRTAIGNYPFAFNGVEHRITISIGLAESWADDDATSIFKRADSALYAAKENGRNLSFRQGKPERAIPLPCEG